MRRLLALFFLFSVTCLSALKAQSCCQPLDHSFYIKVGSGLSVSEYANVNAPSPPWDLTLQGYNAKLGTRAIGDFGIGCEVMNLFDLEVSISYRSNFKYRKFQTPVAGGDSFTREFNLDVMPILFSVNLLGKEFSQLNYDCAGGRVYPMIGAGVGVSHLFLRNYRTTGLPPTGDSSPFASFSAENQYTLRQNFTYTLLIGFEYNYNDCWSIGTGYRWFDAGQFKGPRYQRVANGSAVDVAGDAWKMRFRANEWFVEFKIFI